MNSSWTRRDFLIGTGAALRGACRHSIISILLCDGLADGEPPLIATCSTESRWRMAFNAAIAAPRYKSQLQCDRDSHPVTGSWWWIPIPSRRRRSPLYREIQRSRSNRSRGSSTPNFHWDHWQGNQVYAEAFPASNYHVRAHPRRT